VTDAPPDGARRRAALGALVEQRHVLICCGTGGVGKTTSAAALAIDAARRGRRVVVVTIDPARRLAETLGLHGLSNTPSSIERARWDADGTAAEGGELHALMLDTESTFDHLVTQYATTAEQAQSILDNRFYRNVAGALSGTQEYMAMEKLYELHASQQFDLIVVDTPPTRHALDFLDAPLRLTRFLDNRIFRMIMTPTRSALRVTSVAAQAMLRTIARVVGRDVVDDAVTFFRAFEGMEEGFRDRAEEVGRLLDADSTAFVLVTTPRRDAVEEAEFFAARLGDSQRSVSALIVNRVHPHFGDDSSDALRALAASVDGADPRLVAVLANLADFEHVAAQEEAALASLEGRIVPGGVVHVPELEHDILEFAALRAVGRHLTGG
jgi:anion-transporting  ArsA/GET3 family ATPase